jgi:hypothetical protein
MLGAAMLAGAVATTGCAFGTGKFLSQVILMVGSGTISP